MRVRPMAPDDLEACLELFEAVAAERRWIATEPPVDRREVRARWDALLATGEGTLLVAEGEERPGAPLGLAVLVGRERPELGMLVAAGHRRRGIGDALVRATLAWARGAGARKVVLHVFLHNTGAIALYRRHGFEDQDVLVRAYPRRSGERWDALRMVRPLEGPDVGAEPGDAARS